MLVMIMPSWKEQDSKVLDEVWIEKLQNEQKRSWSVNKERDSFVRIDVFCHQLVNHECQIQQKFEFYIHVFGGAMSGNVNGSVC